MALKRPENYGTWGEQVAAMGRDADVRVIEEMKPRSHERSLSMEIERAGSRSATINTSLVRMRDEGENNARSRVARAGELDDLLAITPCRVPAPGRWPSPGWRGAGSSGSLPLQCHTAIGSTP